MSDLRSFLLQSASPKSSSPPPVSSTSSPPPGAVAASSPSSSLESDSEGPYWEDEDFVPLTKSGKQKTPNTIRNELQKYIDACKASGVSNQTRILKQMDVHSTSFYKFMNPKTYKNAWSAVENSTYWAAARLLEKVKHEREQAKKSGKRKATLSSSQGPSPPKKSKKASKAEVLELLERVHAVEGVDEVPIIYDSCPQIVAKIKEFLLRDGMTKTLLCSHALGGVNSNALARFLAAKQQDQRANVVYQRAYVFFEKLRLLEKKDKSNARRKNEEQRPEGFTTQKPPTCKVKHYYLLPGESLPLWG